MDLIHAEQRFLFMTVLYEYFIALLAHDARNINYYDGLVKVALLLTLEDFAYLPRLHTWLLSFGKFHNIIEIIAFILGIH